MKLRKFGVMQPKEKKEKQEKQSKSKAIAARIKSNKFAMSVAAKLMKVKTTEEQGKPEELKKQSMLFSIRNKIFVCFLVAILFNSFKNLSFSSVISMLDILILFNLSIFQNVTPKLIFMAIPSPMSLFTYVSLSEVS